jgi:hypothetical protein
MLHRCQPSDDQWALQLVLRSPEGGDAKASTHVRQQWTGCRQQVQSNRKKPFHEGGKGHLLLLAPFVDG